MNLFRKFIVALIVGWVWIGSSVAFMYLLGPESGFFLGAVVAGVVAVALTWHWRTKN